MNTDTTEAPSSALAELADLREEIARLTAERDEWRRLALQNEQTAKDALRTGDWLNGMHAANSACVTRNDVAD